MNITKTISILKEINNKIQQHCNMYIGSILNKNSETQILADVHHIIYEYGFIFTIIDYYLKLDEFDHGCIVTGWIEALLPYGSSKTKLSNNNNDHLWQKYNIVWKNGIDVQYCSICKLEGFIEIWEEGFVDIYVDDDLNCNEFILKEVLK